MNWKRWLVLTLVAAAVAVLLYLGFRPQPVLVDDATVTRGSMRVTVETEGKTRLTDRYVISSPVNAFAPRLEMKVGDVVTRGQAILRLRPLPAQVLDARSRAEAEARVTAAEAAVREARKQVDAAHADASYLKSEVARQRQLLGSGDIAHDQFDKTESGWRRAEATLEAARHAVDASSGQLAAARAVLAHSAANDGAPADSPELVDVIVPVSGRVMKLDHESQGVVTAGEPLVEVGNAHGLEVEVDVLSEDAVRIAPEMRVQFERWGGDAPLEGRVRRVEPVGFTKISALGVEEQRVWVIADFTSPAEQWARLGAGYRVEAVFILWEGNGILQVPASALFRYQNGWAVFRIVNGRAARTVVEVGRRTGLVAQILKGLSAEDRIVAHPDESIEEGTVVTVRGEQKGN